MPTEPRTPRTEAGRKLVRTLYVVDDGQLLHGVLAIEAEAGAAPPIDVERLLDLADDYLTMDDMRVADYKDAVRRLAGPPPEPLDENAEMLRRLDEWSEPGPLIRWAAAHLRGCQVTQVPKSGPPPEPKPRTGPTADELDEMEPHPGDAGPPPEPKP